MNNVHDQDVGALFQRLIRTSLLMALTLVWMATVCAEAADDKTALGDLYAVIVGVSKYKDKRIEGLRFSDKDATDFAAFLETQKNLFRNRHVTLLLNEQATSRALRKELFHNLRRAGKDDTVALFFSGHGAETADAAGEYFFVCHDAEPDYLEATSINMTRLRFMDRLESKRVLLIADTCHSGGFSLKGARSVDPSLKKVLRLFKESTGRVILTAARPDEVALEDEKTGNGVFTHYLLEGLKGGADVNLDGIVDLREAYDYVYEKTLSAAGGKQHPQWEGQVTGKFPLSYLRPSGPCLKVHTSEPFVKIYVREKSGFRFVNKTDKNGDLYVKDVLLETPILLMARKDGWKEKIVGPMTLSREKMYVQVPTISLDRSTAFLVLKSDLPRVKIEIDGKPAGVTDTEGILIKEGVQVGVVHQVVLKTDGGLSATNSLVIPPSSEGKVFRAPTMSLAKQPAVAADPSRHVDGRDRNHASAPNAKAKAEPIPQRKRPPTGEPPKDEKDASRNVSLLNAANSGNLKQVKELIAKGADVDSRDQTQWTPLMHACSSHHNEVAKYLISKGADVNASDELGWTALMLATTNGFVDTVELLLSKGADAEAKNRYGETAATKALTIGNERLMKLLGVAPRVPIRKTVLEEGKPSATRPPRPLREVNPPVVNRDAGNKTGILYDPYDDLSKHWAPASKHW